MIQPLYNLTGHFFFRSFRQTCQFLHGTLKIRFFTRHFDSPQIQPLSTIGAGDNFNAGIIYGLLKYDVRHADLPSLDQDTWEKIIRCGMDLASEVCQSYDNYISKEFAAKYVSQS